MKLTAKMIVTLLVVAVPITTLFTAWRLNVEQKRAVENRAERMFSRAAPRIGMQCERTGGIVRTGRRGRGARAFAYDESYLPSDPDSPELPAELRGGLSRDDVAHVHGPTLGGHGASAFRLNDSGPCSVIAIVWTRPPRTDAAREIVVTQSLALVVGLVLTGLLVGFPLVRRIKRLTRAVGESPDDPNALQELSELRSPDELGDLARTHAAAVARVNEQIRELEERDAALESYIGNTTHDLAIPLTVVQHRLKRLQSRVTGEDRELVDRVLEESSYIAALIANMAAAARLEAGQAHLTFHQLDLNEVVERVATRLEPIAEAKNVNFNFAVPPDSVTVEGDSTLLEQAISNVAQNAIQYVGEGGNVVVMLEPEDGRFRLEVFDDGPGVPSEMLDAILERNVRGDAVRTRNEGGSGFGLAIVREVVAQHGWELELGNREEGGLRVLFRGPVAD